MMECKASQEILYFLMHLKFYEYDVHKQRLKKGKKVIQLNRLVVKENFSFN